MLVLYKSIFLMELRKIITYRSDFWINFIGRTFFTITLAYYLWDSIFSSLDVKELNGYSIDKMILYYLFAPLVFRIQQGSDIGTMSKEIYEGGLNKFLLYPMSFYAFKLTTYITHSFFYLLQLILIIGIYEIFFHNPVIFTMTSIKVLMFMPAILLCSLCYFLMTSIVELIAFWADNIWSLNVIIRFVVAFFGGVFIPLSFFPESFIDIINLTPFPYLINFPMQILTGSISVLAFTYSISILIAWCLAFAVISATVWNRGKYKYTGVGI